MKHFFAQSCAYLFLLKMIRVPCFYRDMNFITEQSYVFYSLLIKFVSPVTIVPPKKFVSPFNPFDKQFVSRVLRFVSPVSEAK